MSASTTGPVRSFQTAKEMQDEQRGPPALPRSHAEETAIAASVQGDLVVRAELGIAEAKKVWNDYLEFRDVILSDPACFDEIEGHKEMNRTGATRLALPFGLSIEERDIEEATVQLADSGDFDYRFRVRVRVSKGSRFVDGIGSCRLSEIAATTKTGKPVSLSQREHFALTRAWTRAAKRAIADILGGTEAD